MTYLLSEWYAASLAYIGLWYNFALAARLYILNVADFIHFYCFFFLFHWNETILSSAKFVAQTMTLAKNEKEKEVVVRM